jgi:hypothetical protein
MGKNRLCYEIDRGHKILAQFNRGSRSPNSLGNHRYISLCMFGCVGLGERCAYALVIQSAQYINHPLCPICTPKCTSKGGSQHSLHSIHNLSVSVCALPNAYRLFGYAVHPSTPSIYLGQSFMTSIDFVSSSDFSHKNTR